MDGLGQCGWSLAWRRADEEGGGGHGENGTYIGQRGNVLGCISCEYVVVIEDTREEEKRGENSGFGLLGSKALGRELSKDVSRLVGCPECGSWFSCLPTPPARSVVPSRRATARGRVS